MAQIDALVKRFIDDQSELSPDELDALIDGLRAEPARAVALREQMVVDFLLAQKLTLDRRNFLAQVDQRIADYEQAEEEIDAQVLELRELAAAELERPAVRHRHRLWLQGVLAVSLALLLAGAYFGPRLLPRPSVAVAKVKQVAGSVKGTHNSQATELAGAATLFAGHQIATPADGSVEIEYVDKSVVRIAGDSAVTIDSDLASGAKRLRIDRGQLSADVVPQTHGPMQLVTPHAVATVVGTQFRLTVGPSDTLLEVVEGKVRLDRLSENDSVMVAAEHSGVASAERLEVQQVRWPEDTTGMALALDMFERLEGRVRNPATGNWFPAEWQIVGSASQNEFTRVLDLSGGYFSEAKAGGEVAAMCRKGDEFSLEVILSPAPEQAADPAHAIVLEGADGQPNFRLSQDASGWTLELRTDGQASLEPVRFVLSHQEQPVHLTITYRPGELAIYQGGKPIARSDQVHGSLAVWSEGPLLIGAGSGGQFAWQGAIEGLGLYQRRLDASEVARNVRHYEILAGRGL